MFSMIPWKNRPARSERGALSSHGYQGLDRYYDDPFDASYAG